METRASTADPFLDWPFYFVDFSDVKTMVRSKLHWVQPKFRHVLE
jgi:hypothetical protein